ncbi:hypothetical protein Tco_1419531, partial [Tanacetum coccineum]
MSIKLTEMDDNLEKAATTDTSLDAEQDRGNINTTQSKATPNEAGSQGTTSSGGPRSQDTMGDTIAQTRFENVSKTSNDPLLARGNTLRSANEIASLKKRVKKLERRNKSRTHGLKRIYRVGSSRRVESFKDEGLGEEDASKQGRIADIDANKDIYLVNVHTDEDMFSVNDLDGDEYCQYNYRDTAAITTTTTTATITDVEITLAQALAELKSAKPKDDKVVIQEPEQELASKLHAEKEEERLVREKAYQTEEANIVWDDIQAKIKADYPLAQRLQAQEQKELTDEEKARLFIQFLDQRRKHFAAKRAEEKRNIPPTRAQQRSIMCTYLKNMEGWKPKSLKNKSFANIQELFDKAMKKGRIVRIKRLLDDLRVTAAKVCVTAAKLKLVLLLVKTHIKLAGGQCHWPATLPAQLFDEDDKDKEAVEADAGGSSDVYHSMSRGD